MTKYARLALAALTLGFVASAHASVVVTDPFSYADDSALQAVWGPNATLTTGLTFGTLQTTAGAASISNATARRTLGTDAPYGQSYWASYLVKITSDITTGDIYGSQGATVGDLYTEPDGSYRRLANYPANSPSYAGYQRFSGDNSTPGSPAFTVQSGQTYLALTYLSLNGVAYTNNASILSKQWLFTSAGFASWVAAGKTQASLDTYGASELSINYSDVLYPFPQLVAGSFINFESTSASSVFDELRGGTALADVTPTVSSNVPEPASLELLALSTGLLGLRRRRN